MSRERTQQQKDRVGTATGCSWNASARMHHVGSYPLDKQVATPSGDRMCGKFSKQKPPLLMSTTIGLCLCVPSQREQL